jgi:GntR family transcriptional regulator
MLSAQRRSRDPTAAVSSGTDGTVQVTLAHPGVVVAVVQRTSPIPLYIQIEEELRNGIRNGELESLDQVPSESELSERFSVSRMTARKALDRLVGDGLLFRQPGKGTFVAPPKIAHGPSQQLSFSAAMDAVGLRHETRVLDAGLAVPPEGIAQAIAIPAGAPAVFLRRLRIVEGTPAAIHTSYLPARFAGVLEGDLTGSLTELMAGVGARVTEARDGLEAVIATGEDAKILGVHAGHPLVLITGVAYSSALEPLRYSEALYRGDRFRFSVDSTRSPELRIEVRD